VKIVVTSAATEVISRVIVEEEVVVVEGAAAGKINFFSTHSCSQSYSQWVAIKWHTELKVIRYETKARGILDKW
jgi:predicted alpha-1,6-mannanase (GH76 family)